MALRVFHSPAEWAQGLGAEGAQRSAVLTIGNFDGLHLGHQKILRSVVERAKPAGTPPIAGVVTFEPHPLKVLRPEAAPPLIATLAQRLAGFEQMGIEAAMVLNFDETLSKLSAKEFVLHVLVNQLRVCHVLVGQNFRFGHRQAGDVVLLAGLGRQFGFAVEVVPPVEANGEVVSSSSVRQAVREGDMTRGARLLGRPFALTGEVRRGSGNGQRLLFPTLNLAHEQELVPKNGVYATETMVNGRLYRSATNVGVRPTLDGRTFAVESHLFDFAEQVTSGRIEVRFHHRLRDEQKFENVDALRAQIQRDLIAAQDFFEKAGNRK